MQLSLFLFFVYLYLFDDVFCFDLFFIFKGFFGLFINLFIGLFFIYFI